MIPWIKSDDRLRPASLVVTAGLFSASPDLDTIFFGLIPYGHFFGHRGFFHSPFFIVATGLAVSLFLVAMVRGFGWLNALKLFVVLVAAGVSHALLDAMASAGKGVMLAYPFSTERIFLPWRPLYAPPIRVKGLSFDALLEILRHDLTLMIIIALVSLALFAGSLILRRATR